MQKFDCNHKNSFQLKININYFVSEVDKLIVLTKFDILLNVNFRVMTICKMRAFFVSLQRLFTKYTSCCSEFIINR